MTAGEERRRALAWVRKRIHQEGGIRKVSKEWLAEVAEVAGIEVVRTDNQESELRKADYAEAFGL